MKHISSWFDYVETRSEYEVSHAHYLQTLNEFRTSIGDHAIMEVEKIVKNITQKEKHLIHYNFRGKCTFGFKGDSICESSFSSLKSQKNKNSINGKTPIHSSAMAMIDLTEKKAKRRRITTMRDLNREVIWSKAKVRNDLTKYALGLFNDNFDKRLDYEHYKVNDSEWLVIHEDFGKNTNCGFPTFDRVRSVKVSQDGYMNCSCGKTGEYLLPCVHICRVIDNNEKFTSEMFHVRWHKLFNHAVSAKHIESFENTEKVLKEMLKHIRENHFDHFGKYKGIPLPASLLVKKVEMGPATQRLSFLKDHLEKSSANPILSGSYTEEAYNLGTYRLASDIIEIQDNLSFSICSQTEYHISQSVENTRKGVSNSENYNPNLYDTAHPAFQAAIEACDNVEDAEKLSDHINSYLFKMIARKGNHSMHNKGMSFFGEILSNRNDDFTRHKFGYERRMKKK